MFKELVRYGLVGGLTTGFNLVLFYILERMGVYYLLANTISYYIAVFINYYMNQEFVFKSSNKHGLTRFIILRSGSLIVDNIAFFAIVNLLDLDIMISRIGLSIFIIFSNYIFCKKMIFKIKG